MYHTNPVSSLCLSIIFPTTHKVDVTNIFLFKNVVTKVQSS